MKVTIFGTGYVGLVSGACFADAGNHVVCVDVDEDKVALLNAGGIPIFEPGLEPMVHDNARAGRLEFTTDAERAIEHAEFIFIAVGTPPDEDGSADLRHVLAVASTIGQHLQRPAIVIDKSTVPVGTADRVRATIQAALNQRGAAIEFDVVSNPEFLKEGAAIDDCMKPDRIVIGASKSATIERMKALYAPFNRNHDKIVAMDVRSAELTKYAANAMLATKISFMNEVANIAERVGADVELVRLGIGSDPRIGYSFIYPGAGYGGSCFPKDVKALLRTAGEFGYRAQLLDAVEQVNDRQKSKLIEKVVDHYGEDLSGKTFAVWGLSFKPNTDDMREAPSRVVIAGLIERGAQVRAYDPEAAGEASRIFADVDSVTIGEDMFDVLQGADALIIMTEWKAFWSPDFERLRSALREATIFDGRNIFNPSQLKERGFTYYAIGRGDSVKR